MKNYVKLFPLIIVSIFVLSIYSLSSSRMAVSAEYQTKLDQAREYAENGLLVDALSVYEEVLASNPSIEIALEVGEMYLAYDDANSASSWGTKTLLKDYATNSESYVFVISVAKILGNYGLAFSTYQECEARDVMTDEVQALVEDIWYVYTLSSSFDAVGIFSSTEELVPVAKDGKWGYADSTGKVKITYQYESAGTFSGGVAPVIDETGEAYYIDTTGNKKFVSSYILTEDESSVTIEAFSMALGSIVVGYDGQAWNYYNLDTRMAFLSGYQGATLFNGGVAAVSMDGNSWILIDSLGSQIGTDTYQAVLTDERNVACRSEALLVQMNDLYYLVNRSGEKISETAYLDAVGFNDASYAAVKTSSGWIFVDYNGVEQDFGTYEQAQSFCNGMAAVMVDGLWGYIDTTGTLVIPAVFEEATLFSNFGTSFVKEQDDDEWSLLRLISELYL